MARKKEKAAPTPTKTKQQSTQQQSDNRFPCDFEGCEKVRNQSTILFISQKIEKQGDPGGVAPRIQSQGSSDELPLIHPRWLLSFELLNQFNFKGSMISEHAALSLGSSLIALVTSLSFSSYPNLIHSIPTFSQSYSRIDHLQRHKLNHEAPEILHCSYCDKT